MFIQNPPCHGAKYTDTNKNLISLTPWGEEENMKDISVPDPKAQIWGNLLRGLCSLDRGAPLPRIHLFLYSERKQHLSINGSLTQMISLQPKSQSPKTALLQNHCVTVMVGTYVSTKASWFVGWGVFWEVTESWVCDTHCWISTGFTPGCDTGR